MTHQSSTAASSGADDAPNRPTAPEGSGFERVFRTLAKAGSAYAGADDKGGKFECPVHNDEHASLEVHYGDRAGGVPMVSCPPCEARIGREEFLDALYAAGVRMHGDKVPDPDDIAWGDRAEGYSKGGSGGRQKNRVPLHKTHDRVTSYVYRHADGAENFTVSRWEPKPGTEGRKVFIPSRIVGDLGDRHTVRNLDGAERTPYRLEMFEKWAGRQVILVEGEKAADALRSVKKRATTFHNGGRFEPAEGWVTRYGFDKFAEVLIWPDADEVGVAWARRRADDLRKAGVAVSFLGVPAEHVQPKDDAADVIEGGEFKVRPQRLTDSEVDALAEKCPAEKAEKKKRLSVVGAAKPIVSASGRFEPEVEVEDEPDDGPEPYSVIATQAPRIFAGEYLDRHYRDAEGRLLLRHDDDRFWVWEETHYRPLDQREMHALLAEDLDGATQTTKDKDIVPVVVSKRLKSEVLDSVQDRTLVSKRVNGVMLPAKGGIPFLNGWLDIESRELTAHTPERNTRWVVPVEFAEGGANGDEVWEAFTSSARYGYDPEDAAATEKAWIEFLDRPKVRAKFAGAPIEWLRFLATIGWLPDNEQHRTLRQWYGYLLSGDTEQQKGLLLLGPPRAGKGTILHVAEAFFGGTTEESGGAAATSLSALADPKFGLYDLVGKGLATIGDVRFPSGRQTVLVEHLLSVTAGDRVRVQAKYGHPFHPVLGARLMVATNELPDFFAESSEAIAKRFLALEFEREFTDHEDKGLLGRLLSELDAIVRWALVGLDDLRSLGAFTASERSREIQHEVAVNSNPVRRFVEENCELGEDFFEKNEDLWLAWCEFAVLNKFSEGNSARFSRDLLDAYRGRVENDKETIRGKQHRVKRGIRLTRRQR